MVFAVLLWILVAALSRGILGRAFLIVLYANHYHSLGKPLPLNRNPTNPTTFITTFTVHSKKLQKYEQ
jgi:hypothetical protein